MQIKLTVKEVANLFSNYLANEGFKPAKPDDDHIVVYYDDSMGNPNYDGFISIVDSNSLKVSEK